MRTTSSITTAAQRACELLGWTAESAGGSWRIVECEGRDENPFDGLTYTNRRLLAEACAVIAAPEASGGLGVPYLEIPGLLDFRLKYFRDPKRDMLFPSFPRKVNATEEAVLARMFPPMNQEEYDAWCS